MFQHPAESVLGVFTMSVGDFEDITGIFGTSKYPWLVSVSCFMFVKCYYCSSPEQKAHG